MLNHECTKVLVVVVSWTSWSSSNFGYFSYFNSRSMEWTTTHDVLLYREVLVVEFYRHKKGSNERGRAWTKIAEKLNNLKVRF